MFVIPDSYLCTRCLLRLSLDRAKPLTSRFLTVLPCVCTVRHGQENDLFGALYRCCILNSVCGLLLHYHLFVSFCLWTGLTIFHRRIASVDLGRVHFPHRSVSSLPLFPVPLLTLVLLSSILSCCILSPPFLKS